MNNRVVKKIQERNRRVELDKAWETSKMRKSLITVMTYMIIVFFLILIKAENPWIGALVPALGFLLSTLTLPLFKRIWIAHLIQK